MRLSQLGLIALVAGTLTTSTGCAALKKIARVAVDQMAKKTSETITEKTNIPPVTTAAIVQAALSAAEVITPEQEHYLGRAVGANIIHSYKVADATEANAYLNNLGQSLAMASERPYTHGGYRFAITDSDEIHAFAAPGGFIFISRGLFNLASSESELAAVLAHEVAHVQHRHAVKAIKTSRITGSLLKPASESLSPEEEAEVQESFDGSVNDVVGSLVNAGYSKKLEYQADASAIEILKTIGYDPGALLTVLTKLKQLEASAAEEQEKKMAKFMANHPPASERLNQLTESGLTGTANPVHEARQARFDAAVASLTTKVE